MPFRSDSCVKATQKILFRDGCADDSVGFNKSVLLLLSDGGPDHRLSYGSVQVSLLALFFRLNLDMLIAVRTCPYQSWTNPAERVMSILNLALQNVSLERKEMDEEAEKLMKNNSSSTRCNQKLSCDETEGWRFTETSHRPS